MRILHTADWHLGKIVNGFSMLEDQAYFLDQLIDRLEELKVDVVIMAGDLYDRALPPKEAVALADQTFTRISQDLDLPLLVIAGNHDSKERVDYGSKLLAASNLHVAGLTEAGGRSVLIDNVRFWLLPFADHVAIREVFQDDAIGNIQEGVARQLEVIRSNFQPGEQNVLIYHGYVISGQADSVETSDSERPLSIGTAEYVQSSLFQDFDYVALGHLHKAQRVFGENIRYSGSPLKYSKSEAHHKKQVLLVELEPDHLTVEPVFIKPRRDLRIIRGPLDDLLKESSKDYVFIELTDDSYQLDAMNRLRKSYPQAMSLEYVQLQREKERTIEEAKSDLKAKSMAELFSDFYEEVTDSALDQIHLDLVHAVIEEVEEDDNETS